MPESVSVVIGATLASTFRNSFRQAETALTNLDRRAGVLGRTFTSLSTSFQNYNAVVGQASLRAEASGRSFDILGGAIARLNGRTVASTTRLMNFTTAIAQTSRGARDLSPSLEMAARAQQRYADNVGRSITQNRELVSSYDRVKSAFRTAYRGSFGGGEAYGGGGFGGGGRYGGRFGGGGGEGGPHGGMPLMARAGLHSAFGEIGSTVMVGLGLRKLFTEGANLENEKVLMHMQGMTPDERKRAFAEAKNVSRSLKNTTWADNLKSIRELRQVFGTTDEAIKNVKTLQGVTTVLKMANPHLDASNNTYNLARALELKGVSQDPAHFKKLLAGMVGSIIASGGKITGEDYREFTKYSRGTAWTLSDKFYTQFAPTLMQELGGRQFGTALSTLNRAMIGGRMDVRAATAMANLGILDRSKIDWNTTTDKVRQVLPGALQNSKMFQSNPLEWAQKVFLPKLVQRGLVKLDSKGNIAASSRSVLGELMAHVFSNRNAAQMMLLLLSQKQRLEKDARLNRGVDTLEKLMAMAQNSPVMAWHNLTGSFSTMLSAMAQSDMPAIAHGLNKVADAFQYISNINPTTLGTFTTIGAVMLSLGPATWLAKFAFTAFLAPVLSLVLNVGKFAGILALELIPGLRGTAMGLWMLNTAFFATDAAAAPLLLTLTEISAALAVIAAIPLGLGWLAGKAEMKDTKNFLKKSPAEQQKLFTGKDAAHNSFFYDHKLPGETDENYKARRATITGGVAGNKKAVEEKRDQTKKGLFDWLFHHSSEEGEKAGKAYMSGFAGGVMKTAFMYGGGGTGFNGSDASVIKAAYTSNGAASNPSIGSVGGFGSGLGRALPAMRSLHRRSGRGRTSIAPNAPMPLMGRGKVSGSMSDHANESYRYWRSQGLDHAAAMALVGDEAGEGTLAKGAATGKGNWGLHWDVHHNSGGILQWDPARRANILTHTGIDVWGAKTTHAQQLQAVNWELRHRYPKVWSALKSGTITRAQAMDMIVRKVEVPANPGGEVRRRLGMSRRIERGIHPNSSLGQATSPRRGGSAGSSHHTNVHAPIVINAAPHHNEAQIAHMVKQHLDQYHDGAAEMRSHNFDWGA